MTGARNRSSSVSNHIKQRSPISMVYSLSFPTNQYFHVGTIRATIMIETLPAAVDIEEMIYELREYCCGANAGRWDYIFSIIKRLQSKPEAVLPDRKQVRPSCVMDIFTKCACKHALYFSF